MNATQVGNELPLVKDMFCSPVITIKVIDDSQSQIYFVHKALVVHFSGYFQGALRSEVFEECRSGEVVLHDIEHPTMERFINWMYTGCVPGREGTNRTRYCLEEKVDLMSLIKICILADRLLVPLLTEKAVEAIEDYLYYDTMVIVPACEIIAAAYDNLPHNHKLLRILVNTFCDGWMDAKKDWGPEQFNELPAQFLFDITVTFAEDVLDSEKKAEELERKSRVKRSNRPTRPRN